MVTKCGFLFTQPARRAAATAQKVRRSAVTEQKARKAAVTAKTTRPSKKQAKRDIYVSRPVKLAVNNRPSAEGSAEWNLNQRELKSLFAGFTINPVIIAARRAEDRRMIAEEAMKKQRQFQTVSAKSYSEMARVGATPTMTWSSLPAPKVKPDTAPWSRAQARRDYTRAYKLLEQQQKDALALVQAIAARRPIVVRRLKDRVDFVKRRELLEASRFMRRERRFNKKPKEVQSFDFRHFHVTEEVPETISGTWRASEIAPKVGNANVRATSKKQVKYRTRYFTTSPKEAFIGPLPMPRERPSKQERLSNLFERLGRTELGRALVLGYIMAKIRGSPDPTHALDQFRRVMKELEVEPQMDTEGVIGKPPSEDSHKGNVLITEPLIESDATVGEQVSYRHHAIPREVQTYQNTSDRWMYVGKFSWNINQEVNQGVYTLDIFKDILRKENYSLLNTQLVLAHRLIHSGGRVRMVMNANRYQMGSLLVSVLYNAIGDQLVDTGYVLNDYRNIASSVQRNHSILSAGVNNSIELDVPYHYPDSLIRIREGNISMALIDARVLNKLKVIDGVATAVNVSVYFAFNNSELYGTVDRSTNLPEPQMDTIGNLCNLGGKVLTTIGRDINRDHPPLPLQPASLIPQAMTSMAYMSKVPEPVNVLRADPRAQSRAMGCQNETSLRWILQRPGLLGQLNWDISHGSGTILFTGLASPVYTLREYTGKEAVSSVYQTWAANIHSISKVCMPPIAVLSSCFGYFRGSLKLTIQVIATAFHTGTLMLAIYPGGFVGSPNKLAPTLDELRSCPNHVIDIGQQTEYTFEVPWYNENAWADIVGLGDTRRSSNLTNYYLVVINPLIVTDRVPPSAYLNLFVSAGQDFELAVPRHSNLSPIWNKLALPPADFYLQCYNKEAKVFTSWERNLDIGNGKYSNTTYIQDISDGWSGYLNCEKGCVYELMSMTSQNIEILVLLPHQGLDVMSHGHTFRDVVKVQYAVYDPALSNSNAQGLVICRSFDRAVMYARALVRGNINNQIKQSCVWLWEAQGNWSSKFVGNAWVQCDNTEGTLVWVKRSFTHIEELEVPEGQIDELPIVSLEQSALATKMGLLTFGEVTPDLKDLMRRYLSLASISGKSCAARYSRDCPPYAKICVHPFRKLVEHESRAYDNRAREGIISLLNTAYLGYTGGLRYLFIANTASGNQFPEGTMIFVQHRYDDDVTWDTSDVETDCKIRTVNDFMLTTYATFSQSLNVNNTFKIEVPWYQKEEFRYCIPSNQKFNNGRLYVWVHCPISIVVNLEVYYAYADDTDNICWQGFPALYNLNEITPEPQMDTEPQGIIADIRSACKAHTKAATTVATVQGDIITATEAITKTADSLRRVTDALSPPSTSKEEISEAVKAESDKGSDGLWFILRKLWGKASDKIFGFITHLIYAIISPTAKTIAWAIVNLYHKCFGFTWDGIQKIGECVRTLWNNVVNRFQTLTKKKSPPEQPQEVPEPQMGFNDVEPIGEYAGLLFGLIASFCKVKASPPSWKGISEGLFGIGLASRHSYNVGTFVSDNVRLLKRVFSKFTDLFSIKSSDYALISGLEDDRLKTWFTESYGILANSKRDTVFSDPEWTAKAFELSTVGKGILLSFINSTVKVNPALDRQVRDIVKQLNDLEQQMINRKCLTPVRYEPWCCWIGGAAGCGKSNIGQLLSNEIAKALKCNSSSYSMTFGQAYFDGFNHSSIFIDDFKSMGVSVVPELYAQFLQMKSAVPFNPPFSRVEEKDRFINFYNLFITSNSLFFENEPGIHDCDAYNRRRDFIIELEPKDHIKITDPRANYTVDQLRDLEQSKAYLHLNNRDITRKSRIEIMPAVGETLRDAILRMALENAARYHEVESKVYARRCKDHRDLLNNASGSTLNEYLLDVQKQFKEFDKVDILGGTVSRSERFSKIFEKWIADDKKSSEFKPTPQGDTEGTCTLSDEQKKWPNIAFDGKVMKLPQELIPKTCFGDDFLLNLQYSNGEVMEPLQRDTPLEVTIHCTHAFMDTETMCFSDELQIFFSPITFSSTAARKCQSTSMGQCWVFKDGKPCLNPNCDLLDPVKKAAWEFTICNAFVHMADMDMIDLRRFIMGTPIDAQLNDITDRFPVSVLEFIKKTYTPPIEEPKTKTFFDKLKFWQKTVQDEHELVEGHVRSREPRWKTFTKAFWNGLWTVIKCVYEVLRFLASLLAIIGVILGFLGMTGFILCNRSMASKEALEIRDQTMAQVNQLLDERENQSSSTGVFSRVKAQMHPSGDFKTLKSSSSQRAQALKLLSKGNNSDPELIRFCSSKQTDSFSNIIKKCASNAFFICGVKDGVQYKSRCTGLYNKKFLVIRHYIEYFQSKNIDDIVVVTPRSSDRIQYKLNEIKFQWTDEGYGVGELPASFPFQFSNIVKYMPNEHFDGHYPRESVILEGFVDSSVEHHVELLQFRDPLVIPSKKGMSAWTITQGLNYSWGGAGKCGSLIFCPSMNTPLVGLHTAGIGTKEGFGELLLRETFSDPLSTVIEYVTPQMELKENTYKLEGEYCRVGTLDYNMMVHSPNVTKIVPSEISGVFPIMTSPAPLSSDDPRLEIKGDPYSAGMSKRCQKVREFDAQDLEDSAADVAQMLVAKCVPMKTLSVLSVKEAVEGLTIDGYHPMEMTTSEGYPWIKMRPKGFSNKSWMFEFSSYPDGRKCLEGIVPDLQDILQMKEQMRSSCIVPASYFTGCLKDARILNEKTKRFDKTRIFEISPVDLTIAQRQYFMDFDVAYQTARFDCENTIGINPDGEEWSRLANALISFSPYILTADYSGYGPRLSQTALQRSFDITNVWFDYLSTEPQEVKDRNWNIRESIKMEISQGLHIAKNLVFRPTSGLPSGNAETVIRNSLVNSMYIRVAYLGLAQENDASKSDLYWFKKYVLLFHNGDDLIMSVKADIINWFNNTTLIEWFARYDIKMTDALKSGVAKEWCSLEEATYLKRGFVKHPSRPGQWLAPLEEASITDTANWIWKSLDDRDASLVNSEQCARLAYTRGEAFYNRVVGKLTMAWLEKGVTFSAPSWKSLDMHVWEGTEGPIFSF